MLSEPVLVDTGALLAIYNVNDAHHEACKTQSGSLPVGKALTCWPVITEVVYMLRRHVEARDHFLSRVEAQEFVVLPLSASDLRGVRGVYDKYSDQKVD
jgi:predicted nucleic acid-binding protein